MLGRTHNENGILWLAHSASGVEFTVRGTQCSVKIIGDSMIGVADNQARFTAYVDGERVLDEMITQSETVYDIFSFETEKEVTVTLMKVSEAANSILGIDEITVTAVEDIAPTAEKNSKMYISCALPGIILKLPFHDFSIVETAALFYIYLHYSFNHQ